MLLGIDIGNSNITLGVYDNDKLVFVGRLATDRTKTSDQYATELRNILHIYNISLKSITGSIISSVVPVLSAAFKRALLTLTGNEPMIVGPGIKTGLNIKIDNPSQLGADLVVGAVAAVEMYPLPCIIFDLGTATTISVIDKNGCFLGGTISAGVGISVDALTTHTSQLPQIGLEAPPKVIGTNTIDSMKAGVVLGCAAMLDGLTDRIEDELGERASLVATGGLAPEIIKNCRRDINYCDNLLLEGLRIIYNKNK